MQDTHGPLRCLYSGEILGAAASLCAPRNDLAVRSNDLLVRLARPEQALAQQK